jgi:hypothetical protein
MDENIRRKLLSHEVYKTRFLQPAPFDYDLQPNKSQATQMILYPLKILSKKRTAMVFVSHFWMLLVNV